MNQQLQSELQERIEAFAADVTELLQQAVADGVAEALAGAQVSAPSKRGGKRGKKRATKRVAKKATRGGRRKKGEKRDPKEIAKLEKALLREVKREGGRRIEQIAETMGVTTRELKVPMQHLLENKDVKAKGQARATRYTAK